MRTIKERTEIATTINFHKMPCIKIDLANADEYGLVSEKVLIDNGKFRDGNPYYIHSEIRAYSDESKFKFSQGATGLSSSFGYSDIQEMLDYRNAPIVKADEDVLIVIIDSKTRTAYAPMVLHTSKRIDQFCSTPLTFEDKDYSTIPYLEQAGVKIEK